MNSMVVNQGWNNVWRMESVNLLAEKDIYSKAHLLKQQQKNELLKNQNSFKHDLSCDSDVMRCTLKKIPETANLLQKSRLPLGILIHPFKDDPVKFIS